MIRFFQELARLTAKLLEFAREFEESIRDAFRTLDDRRPELARRVIDADTARRNPHPLQRRQDR